MRDAGDLRRRGLERRLQAKSPTAADHSQRYGGLRVRSADFELQRRAGRASQVLDARHGREPKSRPRARHPAAGARQPRRAGQRASDARSAERAFFPNKIWNGTSPPICGSRCRAPSDNDPAAPMARYFVIHDTSGPNFGRRSFPADVDVNPKINSLAGFKCDDGWGKAHVVVNRSGGMLLDHELSVPWRETKFERAVNFRRRTEGPVSSCRDDPAAAERRAAAQ